MSPSALYVTVLLALCLASAVSVCYCLLRRGLPEDYLSVAVLVGLIVFTAVAVGGTFLYVYAVGASLLALSGTAFLAAFAGMAVALIIAWGILRLGSGAGDPRAEGGRRQGPPPGPPG